MKVYKPKGNTVSHVQCGQPVVYGELSASLSARFYSKKERYHCLISKSQIRSGCCDQDKVLSFARNIIRITWPSDFSIYESICLDPKYNILLRS